MATKTLLKVTKQQLTDSFLSLEARQWINSQNDKEFVRRNLDDKREVFVFTGRAGKLNTLQLEQFNKMHPFGWQAMAVVQRSTTNEFVLVCRGIENGMFGIVYPDGLLERSVARVEFKGSVWDRRTDEVETEDESEAVLKAVEAASTGVTPMVIPQAVEQFPSNAKGMQWDVDADEPAAQKPPRQKIPLRFKVKSKKVMVKAKAKIKR